MNHRFLTRKLALLLSLLMLLPALPLMAEQPGATLRIHYQNDSNTYEDLGLWLWGDVATPSEKLGAWPGGRSVFPKENISEQGAFLDVPLGPGAKEIGMLVIDAGGNKLTPEDLMVTLHSDKLQAIWINDRLAVSYEDPRAVPENHLRVRFLSKSGSYEDMGLWFWGDVVTASEKSGPWPTGATAVTEAEDGLGAYVDVELAPEAKEVGFLFVNRKDGSQTQDFKFDLSQKERVAYMREGDDSIHLKPFEEKAAEPEAPKADWRETDRLYATDAPLGPELLADGTALLRLWAPTADAVEARLYDSQDQHKVIQEALPLAKNAAGIWELALNEQNTGLKDLAGVFYHFIVKRGDKASLVLDPYAPSMAAWNSSNEQGERIGKAALVQPSALGPQLAYAAIPGYKDREDAIIYEAHIRDFTSDPSLTDELKGEYGSFAAFAGQLPYLKKLGVTHIQLLPVLNFYHVNEHDRSRSPDYSSEGENYNWGYDPHHWFALTGMYASDPNDPAARVSEFKALVEAIHAQGMGLILDVVYNHTATMDQLEDIEPGYFYFMDKNGKAKGSFGGGQVGSSHQMVRRLIVDSLAYLSETYKVDGFRFDMMGSLDAETIQQAYDRVSKLNPATVFLGEGWRTFNGDQGLPAPQAADQDWMGDTSAAAVFSDEVRNELKSGFGSEGQPRFLTGGKRSIELLYDNVTAKPHNVSEDDPGDIVQYIAAHDNLTLHDVIALSIKKDPKDHEEEILRRQRLGNALLLTHQGIIFLHSGQEYGRTKQFRHPDYIGRVDKAPNKSTIMLDQEGKPFEYPYFIHDSYDSSDAVNMFDWQKALKSPDHAKTVAYTAGLIALRRSTDAFSYATEAEISELVSMVMSPSIEATDLLIAFSAKSREGGEEYLVIINADDKERELDLQARGTLMREISVLVDGEQAGTEPIAEPKGLTILHDNSQVFNGVRLDALTAVVLKIQDK